VGEQAVDAVLGDGELNEGQIWEAAMAAAKFRLDNLTDIVDYNKEAKDIYEGGMMKQDIYHRTLATLSEILATFRRGTEYEAYFRLTNDPVAQPFDEDYEANVCGWMATLSIEAINPNNIC